MNLFYFLLISRKHQRNIFDEMNNDSTHSSRSIQLILYYVVRAICVIGLVICFILLIFGIYSNNSIFIIGSLILGCISGCIWLFYVVSKEKKMLEDTTLRKYIM